MAMDTKSTGKLYTSDFMKMDKDDPRRQRWEEAGKKAHAQDMQELDKDRYSSASRHKAQQDPNSQAAQVREKAVAMLGLLKVKIKHIRRHSKINLEERRLLQPRDIKILV